MNIKKILEEKQIEIKKVVDEINQLQQILNNKNQEVLRLDGASRLLQELIKNEVEDKKEETKEG